MVPTPVTVSAMTMDSGSTRNATLTRNRPEVIQSNSWGWAPGFRMPVGLEIRSKNTINATTKDAARAPEASHPGASPRHRLPVSSRTIATTSGTAGIRGTRFTASTLQQARVVDVGAASLPIEGDDDGQPHNHFGR